MKEDKYYSFIEGPKVFVLIVLPVYLLLLFFYILAFFTIFNTVGKIIFGAVLAYLLWRVLFIGLKRIDFYGDKIVVNHYVGTQTQYNYSDLLSFKKHKLRDYEVFIIRLKREGNKKRKYSFYCPMDKRYEFISFLKSQRKRSS